MNRDHTSRSGAHIRKLIPVFIIVLELSVPNMYAQVTPVLYAEGFSNPVSIANAGDERLFIVERGGLIRIIDTEGNVETTPFLDLSGIITSGGEQGLLGLAFHPSYSENGYFYVNYTDLEGNTVVERYEVSESDPDIADYESGMLILEFEQPFDNHNGGDLKFGPDGYLYIGTGDGGSGGDPQDNAQDLSILLGKMLRIDVDLGSPYAIPEDNPYTGNAEALDEIWASGLRNPWRYSFDRKTGDLWIADVGQQDIEEVNFVPAGEGAGWNFGWRCYEGSQEYNSADCGAEGEYDFPVFEYTQVGENGCSVTGGFVYRGSDYPSLDGYYFFADYCNNRIYSLHQSEGQWLMEDHGRYADNNFSTFGEDGNGELYIAGISSGKVYRITGPDDPSGIAGNSKQGWTIFPNPAGDILNVEFTNSGQKPERIRIFQSSGRIVKELVVNGGHVVVPVEDLDVGVYIIEITGKEQTHLQKFIRR